MKSICTASWVESAARIGLCGIAVGFVTQSVALNDRVVFSNDRGLLIGSPFPAQPPLPSREREPASSMTRLEVVGASKNRPDERKRE